MRKVSLGGVAAALALAAAGAWAQDKPVELKFAHWLPAQHALAKLGFEPWAKAVEAASKGSIKVVFFPAQQLGKAPDHYDMAKNGVADLTWVNPGYQAGRFPIYAAGELPLLLGNPGGGSAALDAWYRSYAGQEMKDVKFCFAHLHQGSIHSKTPITQPSQFKGVKVRPANGTVASLVNSLGGTNVQVTAPEAREALERGVADAITFPWLSIVSFGIDKAVKYHTDFKLYAATFVWVMNPGFYNGLAPAQKKVIDDHCNNEWAAKVGASWGDEENGGQDKIAKLPGHTIVKVTDADIDAWRKAAEPVYKTWADNVAKTGANPQQLLDGLKAELKKHNALF